MTVVRAGLAYFALVFGAGFVLGVIRVPLVVPLIGERWAELAEMPLMLIAIVFAARWLVRRFALGRARVAFASGAFALALLVGAELLMVVFLQQREISEYVGTRDPVSGSVYLLMLIVFALMPGWIAVRGQPVNS